MKQPLPDLLSDIINAHGGASSLSALTSIRVDGTISVGTMSGSFSSLWERPSSRHVMSVDLGGFTQQSGFDGICVWSVDSNGNHINRTDAEGVGESMVQAQFRNFEFLCDPIAYDVEADEREQEWVIAVTSREWRGAPFASHEFIIDHETFRIIEQRGLDEGKRFTRRFAGYTFHDGVYLPTLITETDPSGNEIIFRHETVVINGTVEDHAFEAIIDQHHDVIFTEGNHKSIIPFTRPRKHLLIDVIINSTPATFVLDTGAERTVISSGLADKLGLEVLGAAMGMGVAGAAEYSIVMVPELHVGGVTLLRQKVVGMDLSSLQDVLPGVEGLLGMDFFSRFVVAFDYVQSTITLFERGRFEYHGRGRVIELAGGRCPMTVNGCAGIFSIDTGSPSIDLFPAFVSRHGLLDNRDQFSTVTMIAGLGDHPTTFYINESGVVEIGGYVLHDIPVRMSEDAPGLFANQAVAGNVGSILWERFITYFDFRGQTLILEPNDPSTPSTASP